MRKSMGKAISGVISLAFVFSLSACVGASHEHTREEKSAVKPTCETVGYTKGIWCPKCKTVFEGVEEIPASGHGYVMGKCVHCGKENAQSGAAPEGIYKRVNRNGWDNPEYGKYVYFGSYPQNEVEDKALKNALGKAAGKLPKNKQNEKWTSYGYYMNGKNDTDFMWYQDVSYEGELYRGVYATMNRPFDTKHQDDGSWAARSKYPKGTTYWFKYEPILWRIMQESNGYAALICDSVIDGQPFQDSYVTDEYLLTDEEGDFLLDENGKSVYANSYAYSSIRKWLNETFYQTAFSEAEQAIIQTREVDNSSESTQVAPNRFASKNTRDKVWLLSYQESLNADYGFSTTSESDDMRAKDATLYAFSQMIWRISESNKGAHWWFRSPYPMLAGNVGVRIFPGGRMAVDAHDWVSTNNGICPVIEIRM